MEQQGRSGGSEAPWPTAVALVGVLAVVAAVFFIFSGNISDSTPDDATAEQDTSDGNGPTSEGGTTAPTEGADTDTDEPTTAPTSGESAPPELITDVGILDGTGAEVGESAQQLLSDGGWPITVTAEYSDRPEETTIYYPDDTLEESAQALADQFPAVTAVEPTIEGLTDQNLVLVLGANFAESVDEPGGDELSDDETGDDEAGGDDLGGDEAG